MRTMMTRLFFMYLCNMTVLLSSASYQNRVPELTTHDAEIVLNLLYISYARSAITLHTQAQAVHSLSRHWDGWHACAMRRLDPNNKSQYPDATRYSCNAFIACAEEYHKIHTTYAHLIAYATLGSSYDHETTLTLVRAIREEARSVIFDAIRELLNDIKQELERLLLLQHASLRSLDSSIHDILEQSEMFSQAKKEGLISTLLNQLAVNSFAECNNSFTQKTDHLFHSFLCAQEQFNRLWQAIEQARCVYYAEQYRTLYGLLHRHAIHASEFQMLADETGIVMTGVSLPSPDTLVVP